MHVHTLASGGAIALCPPGRPADRPTANVVNAAASGDPAVVKVLAACAVPVIAATAGAVWASATPPSRQLRSAIQHFAAGLVFAVAATELIPDLKADHRALAVVVGFALGIAAMLGLQLIDRRAEASGSTSSVVTLAVVGIDVFVDGILIGIGFAEGGSAGPLLAFALTVELLGLGVALSLALQERRADRSRIVATTTGVTSLLIVGGILGSSLLSNLSPAPLSAVLGFATVALLYLVTEELLSEAHETPDTPVLTSMFFLGFLAILLLSFAGAN